MPQPRPMDHTPVHTDDLPATPVRDRTIPATAWVEAPPALLTLGDDIGTGPAEYKRRIGRWVLWRTGPAKGAHARYMALDHLDLDLRYTFSLEPDGTGAGLGPDGTEHHRFRSWKEALRDS